MHLIPLTFIELRNNFSAEISYKNSMQRGNFNDVQFFENSFKEKNKTKKINLTILQFSLVQRISKFSKHQDDLKSSLNHRFLDPSPRISDSLALWWGLGIFVSNKFLDDNDVTSPETMLSSSHCNITRSIQRKAF